MVWYDMVWYGMVWYPIESHCIPMKHTNTPLKIQGRVISGKQRPLPGTPRDSSELFRDYPDFVRVPPRPKRQGFQTVFNKSITLSLWKNMQLPASILTFQAASHGIRPEF